MGLFKTQAQFKIGMMKRIICFYILLSSLFIQSCESQESYNKKEYYLLVGQAEDGIIDNNYVKALNKYNDCYKLNSKMFGVDLYNALLCSVHLKKWADSEVWCNRLVKKGVKIDFFNVALFADFKKTKEWLNVEMKIKQSKKTFDTKLKRQLDSLLIEDQRVYCGIPQGKLNYNQAKQNTITIEEKFVLLLNKHGFPTEETFGLNIINDTVIAFMPTFGTLLRHGYQSNNVELIEIFQKALDKGQVDERVNDALFTDDSNYVVYNGCLYRLKTEFVKEDKLNERKLKFINNNRVKDFLIFAKYRMTANFANESSIETFHKMYDVFIPIWNQPEE